jgi:hypothetical protein
MVTKYYLIHMEINAWWQIALVYCLLLCTRIFYTVSMWKIAWPTL